MFVWLINPKFVCLIDPKLCSSEEALAPILICKISELRKQKLEAEILHDLKEFGKINFLI